MWFMAEQKTHGSLRAQRGAAPAKVLHFAPAPAAGGAAARFHPPRSNRSRVTQLLLSPLRIATETTTLSNGMRVVVHEDRSAPVVAVHIMYHVGSRHERPGRTGLAHLLEHLLFEGSQNCAKGEFDRVLEGVGGSNNGSTWLDRTNYYEVVPTHAVELALWLERERMAFFLPVLDEEMLELQRGVVINERKQAYENRPYGMADERIHQLLFPADHPYSWPTIGYLDDLRAIELRDASEFFSTFYTPRNAVLVLAGDISPEEGVRLAERYFGDIAAGPALPNGTPPAVERRAVSETMEDRVTFPRLFETYVSPAYGTRDWVALDVLTYLLGDGDSSRLHRALVRDRQLAQDVDTFLYPTELAGIWGIVATARSGVSSERMQGAIDEVMAGVFESGVTEEEVIGAARRARRDHVSGIATMEQRADELAYTTTVLGAPEELERVLGTYATVTPEEIREVAARVLSPDARVRLSIVPGKGGKNGRG
jgi:zinc protease